MINLRWFIFLYPRAWRERYQEEFIAMLEQYPSPRIVDIIDLILGAIDARIQAAVQNKKNVLPSPLKEGMDSPSAGSGTTPTLSSLKAQCTSCAKSYILRSADPQYTRIKRGLTRLYICQRCNNTLRDEAILSSGVRPDLIDPVNYWLDK